MKNLIITVGIIVFIVSITGMQFQCNSMLHTRQEMKFAADEAAATAALCLDRNTYGEGILSFDKDKAKASAETMAALNMQKGNYTIALDYLEGKKPGVKVIIEKGKLRAASEYEYVAY